ncbi:MAG: PepSY-associated TM helix domain-containing protein [Tannerella sp.]|jgi:hypothetical protein|nr:PepSY-associated TM helix domain-containing protein [Tannerella sp.]
MKWTRILRVIHRDLGYFTVGFTLVYAISGIILNHLGNSDPAFKTETKTIQFPANLEESGLSAACLADAKLPAVKRILRMDDSRLRLLFASGIGVYDTSSGSLSYEIHEKRILVYWINRLHYNKVKGWSPVADFFAGSLILLAISGLFIVKGKRGLAGSGKWYLIIGILIPILYGIFLLK